MIKNYLKTACRELRNDKLSSAISILGLAAGMASCILILIYVGDELSFNKFNVNIDRIYRLNWISRDNGQAAEFASTPLPLSDGLQAKMPGVEALTKLYRRAGAMTSGNTGTSSDKRFREQNVIFSEPDIFKIFSIYFVSGQPKEALRAPNSVVITEEMAVKYFGTIKVTGRSLTFDNKTLLTVTGVVRNMPDNSDLKFDFLVSFPTVYQVEEKNFGDFIKSDWTFTPVETWLLLKPGVLVPHLNIVLNDYLRQYGTTRNRQLNSLRLQPLMDIHLRASAIQGNASTRDILYVYIFLAIAFLILLIASVNFINLSIARSIVKIKDIGIRKVLGAEQKELIAQFLVATVLISLISFLISLLITQLALPAFNNLTGKSLRWNSWLTPSNLLLFILLFVFTGVLAGLYPAFSIARFDPILALKGKSGDHVKKNRIQKTLLITQFVISNILTIGALVIFQQLKYLREKDPGFQKREVLVVPIFGSGQLNSGSQVDKSLRQKMIIFSDELTRYSRIRAVTAASEMPGQGFVRGLVIPQGRLEQDNIFVPWLSVDYSYISTLKMKIVSGRDFSRATGSDFLNAFVINESAVKFFGWKHPDDAVGKSLVRGEMANGKKGRVIGVVKDFDFNSLDNPMEPLVIDVNPPRFGQFAISVEGDHVAGTIGFIKSVWDRIFPERVFEYSFLDKNIDGVYKDKESLSTMIEYFALIAIVLACSGLFTLAFFLAIKRDREIGIRKVLGANILSIVFLLTRDFLKIILIATLIASPIAWWVMHRWLQGFAYRTAIQWWIFIMAGFLSLLVAFITVGFQSVRAATINPVKSLRSE